MIANSSSLSPYTSNIQTSTSHLTSTTPSTDTSSSNEIQKNNDSLSLNRLSYVLDDNLRVRTNSVEIAYSEASKGAALSEITNNALGHQNNLLTNVSDKLKYILKNETTDATQEIIRKEIITLLDQFDEIAEDSNYKELYSLQESNINTNTSLSYSFRISELPPIVLTTESIQSNTEGLGLSDLKNLAQDGLSNTVANDQSKIVVTALSSIEKFQADYKTLLKSLQTSTNNLSDLYKSFEKSNENTKETNFQVESLAFDRNKILKEMGAFSQAQANALQSNVLSLLSFDSNPLNSFNTSKTSNTTNNDFNSNKEENTSS